MTFFYSELSNRELMPPARNVNSGYCSSPSQPRAASFDEMLTLLLLLQKAQDEQIQALSLRIGTSHASQSRCDSSLLAEVGKHSSSINLIALECVLNEIVMICRP